MAGGANSSIIYSSKYYRLGGFMLILLAALAFGLNILLIPVWGIDGAAMATAISVTVFALSRYLIIYKGFKLQPYDNKMFRILLLIIFGMLLNFILPSTQSAILNIAYRTIIILGVYLFGTYYWKIVPEFHKHVPGLK